MSTELSFADAVAERSGLPVSDVIRVLTENRVPTTDVGGTPHRLRVTRLAFTGKKAGLLTDEIDFDHDFGDGLWAVCTDRNDAGKTSVLELIMWCLRGERKRLQDDVRSWIDHVTLEGTVDGDPFMVDFDNTAAMPRGALTSGHDVRPFASDAAFSDTMSQFMMERLGFESFHLWVGGQGVATHHWPSYSTVLYLPREAEGAVIGDRAGDGVAQQLVQLFVGIPWARTASACRAALKEAQEEATAAAAEQQVVKSATATSLAERTAELAAARDSLAALPDNVPTNDEIDAAKSTWMTLISEHSKAVDELRQARDNAAAAERLARSERKRLRDRTDAALARRLFHGLNPSKCPRCSVSIGSDRRAAEQERHACAVCDRELDLDLEIVAADTAVADEDADDKQTDDEIRTLVEQLAAAATEANERAGALDQQVAALGVQLAAAEEEISRFTTLNDAMGQRRALETQVASLTAVVAELEKLSGATVDPPPAAPGVDSLRLPILAAAEKEAAGRRGAAYGQIVEHINAAILELARRFGFETLEDAKLSLNAQLRLAKGGSNTSFSYQTPGEKLRLRIAVVVALLRVGHSHGVGRHPGLLLIDSIGAEETEPGNLAEFMRELEAVTAELGIETIVASARPEILKYVPANQQLAVTGSECLW